MNVQTAVENRLRYALFALNKAFTTNISFLPMFVARSVKTGRHYSVTARTKVKTANG